MLKIIAACGNGMGSSLMMKMKVEEAFRELSVPVKVEHMSVGEAKNASNSYDVVFVSSALVANFAHVKNAKIIGLNNLLSKDEMLEKIKENEIV